MKTIFQFREGAHFSGDAQAVGERLEKLRARSDGLTPEMVVTDARNIRSILHPYFEWDDAAAAEQHRITQARELIRAVHVRFLDVPASPERQISIAAVAPAQAQPRPMRAFVAIQRDDGARAYESTQRAMADESLRRQVIARAHSELDSVSRKYRELTELSSVFEALDQVGAQLRESTAA